MNWQHFRAFLWLRWRIRLNQLRRGGVANIVVLILLLLLLLFGGVVFFAGSLLLGLFALRNTEAVQVLYLWDAIVAGFLFFWLIVLLTDLQRTDVLTIDKFLHLPVSPTGVFVINYLSSLINVTLILFASAMFGLALGLILSRGLGMILLFPLLVAFFLAVTALTYQFQGWLASLMTNPRRRRTIIVWITAGLILIVQIPNLVNLTLSRSTQESGSEDIQTRDIQIRLDQVRQELNERKITQDEFVQRQQEIYREKDKTEEEKRKSDREAINRIAWIVNAWFPLGWLPYGAAKLIAQDYLPALLGTLAFGLIGMLSLWRGYRTTLRVYTGQYTLGTGSLRQEQAEVKKPTATSRVAKPGLLTKQLPWMPEQSQAVALSTMMSLWRAPEVKMIFLSPVILGALFLMFSLQSKSEPHELFRPIIAFGAITMIFLTITQLAANQFGIDRAGFRVFVLCPAPRWQILLGKNMGLALIPMILGLLGILMIQFVYPMRWDHYLYCCILLVSLYLVYCMITNWLSIFAPIPIAQGSFKPAGVRVIPVVLNMLGVLVMPMLFAPFLLPLAVEQLVEEVTSLSGLPTALGLSFVLFVLTFPLYLLMLHWQGNVLQEREMAILKVVTSKE